MRPLGMDKPKDDSIVDMLSALPGHDRRFCEREANVVSCAGKADAVLCEPEDQRSFVNSTD
eukprot:6888360-Pyramimonas_sp.AAC.1